MAPYMALIKCLLVTTVAIYCSAQTNNARAYDTNDWIPIVSNGQPQETLRAQKTSRVLNTAPTSYQKNFFPGQQSFRETIFTQPQQTHKTQQVFQQQNTPVDVPQKQQQILQQNGPVVESLPDNLTPQFLPHLDPANFNVNLQGNPFLQQQAFVIPPQQYIQPNFAGQPQLVQAHNDFNLLQQVIQNPNVHFVDQIVALNQTQNTPTNNLNQKQENFQVNNVAQIQQNNQQDLKINEFIPSSTVAPKSIPKESPEVQLLYVPLETLNQRKQKTMQQELIQNFPQQQIVSSTEKVPREAVTEQPLPNSYQPDYRKHAHLQSIQQDFAQQALQAQRFHNVIQNNYQTTSRPISSTITPTKKKTKLKAHQPPLAIFMDAKNHNNVKVADVLTVLKDAKTISVLDQVSGDMPQVFVGPSTLDPPNGYAKFELPYLSSIEHTRNQRKVDQLPFFVAPLSYKTPEGFSKIPFPAPHVGSVVISQTRNTIDETPDEFIDPPTTVPNKYINVQEIQNTHTVQRQRIRNQPLPNKPQADISTFTNNQRTPVQISNNGANQFLASQQIPNQNDFLTAYNQHSQINNQPLTTPSVSYIESSFNPSNTPVPNYSTLVSKPAAPPVSNAYKGHFVTHGDLKLATVPQPDVPVTRRPVENVFTETGIPKTPNVQEEYTVLEQFPVQQTTTQKIVQSYISTNKPTTIKYSAVDLEKYRSDPVGINDQFSNLQYTQNEELIPAQILLNQQSIQSQPVTSSTVRTRPTQNQESQAHSRFQQQKNHRGNQQRVRYSSITRGNSPQQHQQSTFVLDNENNLGHQLRNGQSYVQEQFLQPTTATNKVVYQENVHTVPNITVSTTETPPIIISTEKYLEQFVQENANDPKYQNNLSPTSYNAQINDYQPVTATNPPENHYSVQPLQVHLTNTDVSSTPSGHLLNQQQNFEQVYSTQLPRVEINTHSPQNNREYQQQKYRTSTNEQQFSLSGQLPPINPNLPGLINSLQDSQLYENEHTTPTPVETISEITTPYHSIPSSTYPSRKQVSRGRQRTTLRQPVTTTTVTTPTRGTQSRRRRPYNGRPRPEYEKYLTTSSTEAQYLLEVTQPPAEPIYSQPSTTPHTYIDVTTARPTSRVRYNYQREQQSYTTEPPKRNVNTNVRQRFRTRTRTSSRATTTTTTTEIPIVTEPVVEYENKFHVTEQNSFVESSPSSAFQQPKLESGFEASPHFATQEQNVQYHQENYDKDIQLPQQSPVYQHNLEDFHIQTQDSPSQDVISVQVNNPAVTSRLVQTTEQPVQYSQNVYENTATPGTYTHQPIIISSTEKLNQQIGLHQGPRKTLYEHEINHYNSESSTHTPTLNIKPELNIQYDEPVHPSTEQHFDTTTTQKTVVYRTRGRTRGRTRNSYTTTPSTTTTFIAEKQEPEEKEEEFYGFIRKPNFQRPALDSYKESSEIRQTPTHVPNHQTVYFSPTERGSTISNEAVYIESTENPSSAPLIIYDEPVEPEKVLTDQVNETPLHTTPTYEEQPTTKEVRTRKPYEGNFINRSARPARPTHATILTTTRATSNERYTVRPAKRPEPDTPKVTRIRGRIRKPTRPTTTTTEETVQQQSYQPQQIYQPQQNYQPPQIPIRRPHYQPQTVVNELVDTGTVETVTKTRGRIASRGRGHFKHPKATTENNSNDSLENANYPVAFIQAQEAKTQKPEFKITIGAFDEDYSDQVPYSTINKPSFVIKSPEDGAEESQWSTKYTSAPLRRGYPNIIRRDEKNNTESNTKSEETEMTIILPEKNQTGDELENFEQSSIEQSINMTDTSTDQIVEKSLFEKIFEEMSKFQMEDTPIDASVEDTNDSEELEGEIKFTKGKKRGFWRKVRVRPVDGLETAESQNIVSNSGNLISDSDKKNHPKPYVEQYVVTLDAEETTYPTKFETQTDGPPTIQIEDEIVVTTIPVSDFVTSDPVEEVTEMSTVSPDVEEIKEDKQDTTFDVINPLLEMFGIDKYEAEKQIEETEYVTSRNEDTTTVDYSVTEANDDKETNSQITTDVPLTTIPNFKDLDISTESQNNETKTDNLKNKDERAQLSELWNSSIIGTSTSTEVSHETEICFRGRCVKSNSTESTESN